MKPRLLLIALLIHLATANEFYPYGEAANDQKLDYTVDQHAVVLDVPIVFVEKSHDELFLSHNGIVGVGQKAPEKIVPLQQITTPSIAVFYAPASSGSIFFRVTSSDQSLLRRLTNDIRGIFADASDFSALQAILITWTDVENAEKDGPASFQLLLVSDGISTYSLLNFGKLPWSSSMGYYAQSGFVHSHGKYQSNVNSGGPDVKEIVNLSNNKLGTMFVYRISNGNIEDPRENGEEYEYSQYDQDYDGEEQEGPADCPKDAFSDKCPKDCSVIIDGRGCSKCICAEAPAKENEVGDEDDEESQPVQPEAPRHAHQQHHQQQQVEEQQAPSAAHQHVQQTSQSQQQSCANREEGSCHANAICQDYDAGFCCVCGTGFYGNGKECIAKGEPQRITGSFEGVINGIAIDRTDLHTFVTASDGNVYTAVSKIPSDLGHPMLLLSSIGSIMGWLFAEVQSPTAYNGFQLTGGLFNRTVTLHIGTNYYVSIKQEFSGRDIYHYFKSHVFVSGTLPDIAPGSEIIFPDYEEEYRREKPGFVSSSAAIDVVVKDGTNRQPIRITVDQQIHFSECPHKTFDRDESVVLQVKRVHVTYDTNEGIVRYGSRNYATRRGASSASASSQAVAPAGSHFDRRQHADQTQQADVCASGRHACTLPNMRCRAVDPSYRCECEPGYQANHDTSSPIGWRCVDLDECTRGDHNCDQHAICTNKEGSFSCECRPGFSGDGRTCIRDQSEHQHQHHVAHGARVAQIGAGTDGTCTNHQQCHQWGECVFTSEHPTGRCKCRGWYTGDGVNHCGPPGEEPARPQQHNANIPQRGGHPCGTSVCDVHAECLPDSAGGSECVCKAGYSGDGIRCEALIDETPRQPVQQAALGKVCRSHDECSEHGSCAYHHQLGYYQCACTDPYIGNGVDCTLPGAAPAPADSTSKSDTLLIARGMAIFERSTKPDVFGKQLIVIPHHIPVGIDFDCKDEKIVWSDISGHSIRLASLNGTDHKSFLAKELSSPEGIAVDWSSRNVYYADSLNDEIGVASLNGKYKKSLITEGLVNPRSLAIDLNSRHLYYSDWHRENPYIGRVDLDGSNNKVFLNDDVHLPNGLTVLPNRRELCWVDAGSHRLSCIGFNGGGRRVVFASLQYPFGLTHDNEQKFYWTDWKDNRVHSVGIYGESYGSFPISLGGSGKVFGILSLPKRCVGAPTQCGTDNGGCKYLCLPSQHGPKCECPDNVSVSGC